MNAEQRLREFRAWVEGVPAARIVAVLPCVKPDEGSAEQACSGGKVWRALQQFALNCEALSGDPAYLMLDEKAGVLLPSDEVRHTTAPAATDAATARELDELVEDAAFVILQPPGRRLPHAAVFTKRMAFDVFGGLTPPEAERLAAKLADLNWPARAKTVGSRMSGLLVLLPPPNPEQGWVPLLHQIVAVKGGQSWAAPWPRTGWPQPAVKLTEGRYVPLPYRRRVLTDDELHALLEARQAALAKRAAATGAKRAEPAAPEPFGPDLDELGWLKEQAIPWRVNADAYRAAAMDLAEQAAVPRGVVEGVLGPEPE